MARFAKCLRCHLTITLPLDIIRLKQCPHCNEKNFITYYEHIVKVDTVDKVEVKGGDEQMTKKKEVVEEKSAENKKPSFVTRVAELKNSNTPDEIKDILSVDYDKCTLGKVKSTIKYLESKKKA